MADGDVSRFCPVFSLDSSMQRAAKRRHCCAARSGIRCGIPDLTCFRARKVSGSPPHLQQHVNARIISWEATALGNLRAPDAVQRVALCHKRVYARLRQAMAVRCRAGAVKKAASVTVPVLRSSVKNAASRPGHGRIFVARMGKRNPGTANAEALFPDCAALHPGYGLIHKLQTAKLSHSRGAKRPRFASPSQPREGMERREAPGHQRAPLEAGLTYPPRAARHRARPRLGAAPPGAPPATRPSTVPGRPGPASFRSVR
jgi:hypothetical protein